MKRHSRHGADAASVLTVTEPAPQYRTKTEVVSSEDEPLILVDGDDRAIGFLDKSACHDGDGVLHRAFSLFVFNAHGQLLVQRRASNKRLWPGYWSNSCCSHPRRNEDMALAVARRLQQELSLQLQLEFLYKFEYHARFGDVGSEHELCWVYAGRSDAAPVVNTTEIDAWRWLDAATLDRQLADPATPFTPWFKLEWQRIKHAYPHYLQVAAR